MSFGIKYLCKNNNQVAANHGKSEQMLTRGVLPHCRLPHRRENMLPHGLEELRLAIVRHQKCGATDLTAVHQFLQPRCHAAQTLRGQGIGGARRQSRAQGQDEQVQVPTVNYATPPASFLCEKFSLSQEARGCILYLDQSPKSVAFGVPERTYLRY